MRKFRKLVIAVSGVGFAATLPSFAQTGSSATRQLCWDTFCQNVKICIGTDTNPQVIQQCLMLRMESFTECLQEVGNWGPYGPWEPALGGELSLEWCRQAFDARVSRCMQLPLGEDATCFDTIPEGWEKHQIDALRSVCMTAAKLEKDMCRNRVLQVDPIAMKSFLSGEAILENKITRLQQFTPSEQQTTAQWIGVPMPDSQNLTGATLRVLTQSATGEMEWVDFSEHTLDAASGMVVVELNLNDVPRSVSLPKLAVTVTWHFDGAVSIPEAYIFDIAESGIKGDFDRNGVVNEADLIAFTESHNQNGLRADMNRNGVVNASDIDLFLSDFSSN